MREIRFHDCEDAAIGIIRIACDEVRSSRGCDNAYAPLTGIDGTTLGCFPEVSHRNHGGTGALGEVTQLSKDPAHVLVLV